MLRTPQALIPYILAIAAVLGGWVWHAGDRMQMGQVITTGAPTIGGPFTLVDGNGHVYTDKDLKGHWSLVYFGYTHCPDVCPITLELMADALGKMGAKAAAVTPIFITVDPDRDTPKTMKAYVAAFGPPKFIGLTGTQKEISQAMAEYHVYSKKRPLPGGDYGMDHSSAIYLMDPNGRFATAYNDVTDPKKIASDIEGRL